MKPCAAGGCDPHSLRCSPGLCVPGSGGGDLVLFLFLPLLSGPNFG